jgi:hypothetical protein
MKKVNTKTNGRVNETNAKIKALTIQLIEEGETKGKAKKLATLKVLQSKKIKTEYERQRIINLLVFFDNRTLSQVWKMLTKSSNKAINEEVKLMLGKSKFPQFKEWTLKAREGKTEFTVWDGLQMLRKFNKVEQTQKRVKRQNKAQALKVA